MSKKLAVVTGSNKGIGFHIASKLCDAGVKTILACRNEELGLKAVSELKSKGYDCEYRNLDISDKDSVLKFTQEFAKDYEKLDILVNNAAIAFKGSDPTPFKDQANATVKPNFFGTLEVTNNLLPLLSKSAEPRIVNVASQAGRLAIIPSSKRKDMFTSPTLSVPALEELMTQFVKDVEAGKHSSNGWPNTCYGTSKLGVIALTKILARDHPSMRINCCCPGYCATDMSSHGGPRSAEQGARTPAMLALMKENDGPTGKFFFDENEIDW